MSTACYVVADKLLETRAANRPKFDKWVISQTSLGKTDQDKSKQISDAEDDKIDRISPAAPGELIAKANCLQLTQELSLDCVLDTGAGLSYLLVSSLTTTLTTTTLMMGGVEIYERARPVNCRVADGTELRLTKCCRLRLQFLDVYGQQQPDVEFEFVILPIKGQASLDVLIGRGLLEVLNADILKARKVVMHPDVWSAPACVFDRLSLVNASEDENIEMSPNSVLSLPSDFAEKLAWKCDSQIEDKVQLLLEEEVALHWVSMRDADGFCGRITPVDNNKDTKRHTLMCQIKIPETTPVLSFPRYALLAYDKLSLVS